MMSCVFGAKSLFSLISSLTVKVNPSLPAPDPYETTNILSPGSATSKILDKLMELHQNRCFQYLELKDLV